MKRKEAEEKDGDKTLEDDAEEGPSEETPSEDDRETEEELPDDELDEEAPHEEAEERHQEQARAGDKGKEQKKAKGGARTIVRIGSKDLDGSITVSKGLKHVPGVSFMYANAV
ncbi:MAG: hypothetical protein JXC85_04945, partial [Candidatus Aenigmarchaeota archaeon]|nr:hypothetical protein [Candidatus Aenigmarchaeota archaeon]